MSKITPSKRKSIHDQKPLEEIKDNVKNNAIVTRSKTQERLQREMTESRSDENGLSALSSDEEELINEVLQRRRSASRENEMYARLRSQRDRSTSGGSEDFDSSFSPTHDTLKQYEPESARNNLKDQVKNSGKSDRLSSSGKRQSVVRLKSTENQWSPTTIIAILCVCLAVVAYCSLGYEPGSDKESKINVLKCGRDDLECLTNDVKRTLKSMQIKYKNQDADLWKDVYIGIRNIIHDRKKPSIIVLLGSETDFVDCLAVLLGNISSNALQSGLLQLHPGNFGNDMGTVITSLRSSIKDKKAVIVWDLLNINEEALKAFHNLCDRINPAVEEVIYIITIVANDYDKKMKPIEFVEKKLYKKLSGKIKEDAIQPLITRITDGPILTVKPEPDILDCPLPKVPK